MNIHAFLALTGLPTITANRLFYECRALNPHKTVEEDASRYSRLGYEVNRLSKGVATAQRDSDRLKIVHGEVEPTHDVLAVQEEYDWAPVAASIAASPDLFSVVSRYEEAGVLRSIICRHLDTDAVLEVVWRDTPIFSGVFPEKK